MIAKRMMDLVGSVAGLLVLSPLFLVIALCIMRDSEGPVLFRQARIGRRGVPFRICKFRTMVVNASAVGPALTHRGDPRITRIGRFLRRHKLDELPQLWNVLIGDMSLVGPRPEVPEFVALYTAEQREKILSLRPGITDLASLEFRNESDQLDERDQIGQSYADYILPRKLEMYETYVDERTLWLDLRIIFATVSTVLLRHDAL